MGLEDDVLELAVLDQELVEIVRVVLVLWLDPTRSYACASLARVTLRPLLSGNSGSADVFTDADVGVCTADRHVGREVHAPIKIELDQVIDFQIDL